MRSIGLAAWRGAPKHPGVEVPGPWRLEGDGVEFRVLGVNQNIPIALDREGWHPESYGAPLSEPS